MKDKFGRTIDYLRVSVTDRCNFRCVYCMPPEGVPPLGHKEILTYEEILTVLSVARKLGISHVRITGGEPLVRKNLDRLVRGIATLGFPDISMTTNGCLLSEYAGILREAGLMRVNISLDSLRPDRFSAITRTGQVADVLEGMKAAVHAGLSPVKVNVVVMAGWNADEAADIAGLTLDLPVHVRFIEYMPIGPSDGIAGISTVPSELIMAGISRAFPGKMRPCEAPSGAGPAGRQAYALSGAQGTIGFISPVSRPFCSTCSRLRLTADGKLRPCLASDVEVDVKGILRGEESGHGPQAVGKRDVADERESAETVEMIQHLEEAFKLAVQCKPAVHGPWVTESQARRMCQIGG